MNNAERMQAAFDRRDEFIVFEQTKYPVKATKTEELTIPAVIEARFVDGVRQVAQYQIHLDTWCFRWDMVKSGRQFYVIKFQPQPATMPHIKWADSVRPGAIAALLDHVEAL